VADIQRLTEESISANKSCNIFLRNRSDRDPAAESNLMKCIVGD